jgi:hypothetical protein
MKRNIFLVMFICLLSFSLSGFNTANAAPSIGPYVSGAAISGTPSVGETLTGGYTYGFNSDLVRVGSAGFSIDSVDSRTSMALDNSGVPYVAYADGNHEAPGRVTVNKYNSGTNTWSRVGPQSFSAGSVASVSLAFDTATNTPYVAYPDGGSSNKATVKVYNSGANTWDTVGTVGFTADAIKDPSLAFNPSTHLPYIAYWDGSVGGKISVMRYDGAAWQAVGAAGSASSGTGLYPSLDFNPTNNQPYVAYSDSDQGGKVTVKYYDGAAWQTVGTAGFTGVASYISLKFNPVTNLPYVLFRDAGNGSKATAFYYESGVWRNLGSVGFSSSSASYLSLDFNSSGSAHAIYSSNDGAGDVKISYYNIGVGRWEDYSFRVTNEGVSLDATTQNSGVVDRTTGTVYTAFKDGRTSSMLTVAKYLIEPEGSSTYKWYRDGVEIVGETSDTYVVTEDDINTAIRFEVTPVSSSGMTGTAGRSAEVSVIASLPTLTTSAATNVTRTTVTLNGEMTDTGGENATARGFEYGLDGSYGTVVTESGDFSTGVFSSNLTGLTCNTVYHYASFATNSAGTEYGDDMTFTTSACASRSVSGSYSAGYKSGNSFVMNTPQTVTPSTPKFTFTKNLKFLTLDNEVKELQKFLNTHGYPVSLSGAGSSGLETTKFGLLTQKALIKFQKANNITPAVGYFGPITRAKVNSLN